MMPWIWYGMYLAKRNPLQEEYDLFCFVPTAAAGGAERVNADIIRICSDKKIIVFFTKKSQNTAFLPFFQQPHVTIRDISAYADNKKQYWNSFIYRGLCAAYINRQAKRPVLFSGQCNFGYKLMPHVNKDVRKVEFIHVSERKFAGITFPFIPLMDIRITGGNSLRKDHLQYYAELGVPSKYNERWRVITTMVPLMLKQNLPRTYGLPLKVYYVGRGGAAKRVWLIIEIIRKAVALQLPVEFHMVGPLEDEIPADVMPLVHFYGIIRGQEALYQLHQQMDIMLMTSAFEGFPVVIMEAMANGVVPLTTAVNAIPEHITHGNNGFLITDVVNEQSVVAQAIDVLQNLCADPGSLSAMSDAAFQYAQTHFDELSFSKEMRKALFE